jgi:hypothetical protein
VGDENKIAHVDKGVFLELDGVAAENIDLMANLEEYVIHLLNDKVVTLNDIHQIVSNQESETHSLSSESLLNLNTLSRTIDRTFQSKQESCIDENKISAGYSMDKFHCYLKQHWGGYRGTNKLYRVGNNSHSNPSKVSDTYINLEHIRSISSEYNQYIALILRQLREKNKQVLEQAMKVCEPYSPFRTRVVTSSHLCKEK